MCPCQVDHWLHVAAGFQGIVGMMVNLSANDVLPSDEAMRKLEEQFEKLKDQVEAQRHKKSVARAI